MAGQGNTCWIVGAVGPSVGEAAPATGRDVCCGSCSLALEGAAGESVPWLLVLSVMAADAGSAPPHPPAPELQKKWEVRWLGITPSSRCSRSTCGQAGRRCLLLSVCGCMPASRPALVLPCGCNSASPQGKCSLQCTTAGQVQPAGSSCGVGAGAACHALLSPGDSPTTPHTHHGPAAREDVLLGHDDLPRLLLNGLHHPRVAVPRAHHACGPGTEEQWRWGTRGQQTVGWAGQGKGLCRAGARTAPTDAAGHVQVLAPVCGPHVGAAGAVGHHLLQPCGWSR